MKQRKLSLDIILIVTILILTVLVLTMIFFTGQSKFKSISTEEPSIKEIKEAPEMEDSLEIIQSNYDEFKVYQESSNNPTNPYSIQYIVTEDENLNNKISEYIDLEKQQFHNTVIENSNQNTSQNKKLEINLDINSYKTAYYSFVFTKTERLRDLSVNTAIKTFFFNKNTGEIVNFSALLKEDMNHLQILSNYVYKKMLENEHYKGRIDVEKWKLSSSPAWDNYTCFSIKNDSLELYFEPGDLGKGIDELSSIAIPLSFINPIIAADIQSSTTSDVTILPSKPEKKPNVKRVALTFDDGPHSQYTKKILQTLEKYNAHATFFILGSHAEQYPDIIKEIAFNGHEIGNHSWSHLDLTKLPAEQVMQEYKSTTDIIYKITGQNPTVFRPPYGAKDKKVTASIPIPIVLWNLDTLDWKEKDSKKLLAHVKTDVKDNSIILMHDIHESTADGLEKVLAFLQKEGYHFVTVSELLENK